MRMLQDEAEIARFVEILRAEGAHSYLEIGSKFGGSFERVALSMPPGSRVVSVDLPSGSTVRPESEHALEAAVKRIRAAGVDAHLIWGDSTAPATIATVRRLGPFDAVLIDANHAAAFVKADWCNYGPLGRIVGFHDIAWRRAPEWKGDRIAVPEFWESIKGDFRHEEIRLCPTGKNNGIGVLWR